jgi:DNA modification methylase
MLVTFSKEGDLIYDCFSGSGTVLLASKKLNRNFIGSEIVKEYCDIILERLKD